MTPIGDGMTASVSQIVAPAKPHPEPARYSLWPSGKESMFHDHRARTEGDVITVLIQINDWASLDNSTKRSRGADLSAFFGAEYSLDDKSSGASEKFTSGGKGSAGSDSTFTGKGSIGRSEKIKLSIAAVITKRLPNGNFILSGSQEVRVNNELRVLRVSGIVRPEDISQDNTISYDRIAEARISYGGRGRISEVQQPGWGQQIWDIINPF
jgi:flagellar L-ring protein precursor FlgH